MRVGMMLNYSGGFTETVSELSDFERAGLQIVFVPEAYSFDAVSQLGFIAARTTTLEIADKTMEPRTAARHCPMTSSITKRIAEVGALKAAASAAASQAPLWDQSEKSALQEQRLSNHSRACSTKPSRLPFRPRAAWSGVA